MRASFGSVSCLLVFLILSSASYLLKKRHAGLSFNKNHRVSTLSLCGA